MERLKSSPDAKRGHLGEPGSRKVLWVVMTRLNESPKEWPPLDQDRPELTAVKRYRRLSDLTDMRHLELQIGTSPTMSDAIFRGKVTLVRLVAGRADQARDLLNCKAHEGVEKGKRR